MSAAATAAGYLYASGRLRGRNDRNHDERGHDEHHGHGEHQGRDHDQQPAQKPRRQVKVAVYQPEPQPESQHAAPPRPKKTPKIEYRTRRWKPE